MTLKRLVSEAKASEQSDVLGERIVGHRVLNENEVLKVSLSETFKTRTKL